MSLMQTYCHSGTAVEQTSKAFNTADH